jgi:hypothetical protein
MFSAAEALGLVMAVLEGHPASEDDPVGQALGKLVRALPEPPARPADAVRRVPARGWHVVVPDVHVTLRLVEAADHGHRVRLRYGRDAVTGARGSGTSRSTRGRSSSAIAGGTCWAGRTTRTRGGSCGSTRCATWSSWPSGSRLRPTSTRWAQ